MELKYINPSLQKEWEDLMKKNPASGFMQSFFWAQFQNSLGWETYKIGIFEKEKLVGGAIIAKYMHFKKHNVLFIPEGPVLPYSEPQCEKMFQLLITEIDKIVDLTGKKPTSHLSIEPKLKTLPPYFSRFRKSVTDQQPIRTLIINLTLSEAELLRQMKPKGRYNIKLAQKHGVEIFSTDLSSGLADFLNLYHPFADRLKFEKKDDTYFASLIDILNSLKIARFYFAKYKGQLLAAALVLDYGEMTTFLFGASSEKEKKVMASYLLHWEIIRQAKVRGMKKYDFYSLAPGDNINHPWYGYSVFKRKFGGKEENYIGGYDFVYNEIIYRKIR